MTYIYYTLIPLLLLLTAIVLLRKRGMKSKNYIVGDWDGHTFPIHPLHPQEKSNPTSKENENG